MAEQFTSKVESIVESRKTPGIGAVLLDKNGNKLYEITRGPNSLNDTSKGDFTNDTQMYIQSCTKLITCICVLQLLEQGKISSIDDRASKYLPRQSAWKVASEVDEDGTPHLHDPKREITLRDLLTHTSGMTYDFFGGDEKTNRYRKGKDLPVFTTAISSQEWHFYDAHLDFDPGEDFHYGMSIDHVGFVFEEITGMRLEDYIQENILVPLGMNNSGHALKGDDFFRIHATLPDGNLIALEDVKPATKESAWKLGGGHFLASTMNDYSKVLVAMLNEGTHPETGVQLLKPETVKEYVFKDLIPKSARKNIKDPIGLCRESLVPGVGSTGDVGQILAKSDERGWSATFLINKEDAPGGRKAGSGAWAGLCNAYYWVDPESGLAGFITTNKLPFADKEFLDLFVEFEKFAYSQKKD